MAKELSTVAVSSSSGRKASSFNSAIVTTYVDAGARHIAIRIGTLHQNTWVEQLNQLALLPLPR